jgi:Arm DNA-binding domain
MPKLVPPLTENQISAFSPGPRRYKRSDGKRLYLVVEPTGVKRWHFSVDYLGKPTTFSFGAFPAVSLESARQQRDEILQMIEIGINPVVERKEKRKFDGSAIGNTRILHMSMNNAGGLVIENKSSRIVLSSAQVTALKTFLIATDDQPKESINA